MIVPIVFSLSTRWQMFSEMFQIMPSNLFDFLPPQLPDFTIADLSSESDEIPDVLALDEDARHDYSHANGPSIIGQRTG